MKNPFNYQNDEPLRVLLTGSNGLLGQKLQDAFATRPNFALHCTSRGPNRQPEGSYTYHAVDLTDAEATLALMDDVRPNIVLNAAAMTNVDACEADPDTCHAINVDAVVTLIEGATRHQSHIVQLSTDFVFDGLAGPYSELDDINPLSAYGRSKADAEGDLLRSGLTYTILRTVLVYGHARALGRSNMVLWATGAARKGETLRLVTDQLRTPTLAEDLAQGCMLACEQRPGGIFHIAGVESLTIDALGERILVAFGLQATIERIDTASLAQAAPRPLLGGLKIDKAMAEMGYRPTPLDEGLALVRRQLQAEGLA